MLKKGAIEEREKESFRQFSSRCVADYNLEREIVRCRLSLFFPSNKKKKKKISIFVSTKRNFAKEKRLVFLFTRERKKSNRFRVAKINDEKLNEKGREKRKEKRF